MTTTRTRKALAATLDSPIFILALIWLGAAVVYYLFGTQLEAAWISVRSAIETLLGVQS